MGTVENGETRMLKIEGVHDGPAGVQEPSEGERQRHGCDRVVAFRANAMTRKPEVGDAADLDGVRYRIMALEPSRVTAGFERAYLVADGA